MLITKQRRDHPACPVKGIRVSGRNTQGVKLVELHSGDVVRDVARVVPEEEGEVGAVEEEPVEATEE